jgi:ADP-heptose:LPS heptosyltransferase
MYKIINRKKLIATALADCVGRAVTAPSRLLSRPGPIYPGDIRSILVIRTAYIGDVVMTIPLLKPLRERYPYARITFLTSRGGAQVLSTNPYVDEVVAYDPFWFYKTSVGEYIAFMRSFRGRAFDLVIEARADIRDILFLVAPLRARFKVSYNVGGGGYLLTHVVPYPGLKHKVQYHLDIARYLGAEVGEPVWDLYLTDEERARAGGVLGVRGGVSGEFIAVHPGTRLPLKRWRADRYAALYDALADRYGLPIVMLGAENEEPIAEILGLMSNRPVTLAGKLSLREVGAVLARARVFVCNDSAPMHIAAALGVPTAAFFGPSKSIETGPWGARHRTIEKEFPCRYRCDENTCLFERHHACMEDIGVDDALAVVATAMGE